MGCKPIARGIYSLNKLLLVPFGRGLAFVDYYHGIARDGSFRVLRRFTVDMGLLAYREHIYKERKAGDQARVSSILDYIGGILGLLKEEVCWNY